MQRIIVKENKIEFLFLIQKKYIKDWFKFKDENGRIYRRRMRNDNNGEAIWIKQYLDESPGVPLSTVWNDIQQVYADPRAYKEGNKSDVEVIKDFSGGQKPEALIARIIKMASDPNDIILDFHLGTGTTAATAHKMGRHYIGVEQMDNQINIILKRLPKVINGESVGISKSVNWRGGGSFVYCELAKANQQFADNIEQATSTEELTAIWEQIQETGFLSWKVNPKEIDVNAEDFTTLSIENQKRFLIECLDKNLLYVPYSEIDNAEFAISESDKKINNQFYQTK